MQLRPLATRKSLKYKRPRRTPQSRGSVSHPQNPTLRARKHDLRAFFVAIRFHASSPQLSSTVPKPGGSRHATGQVNAVSGFVDGQ